jgi:hypothetical protein
MSAAIASAAWLLAAACATARPEQRSPTPPPEPERAEPRGTAASSPRVQPTLALDSAIGWSALTLEQAGRVQRDYAVLYHPIGAWVGVQVGYGRVGDAGRPNSPWRGTFELGVRGSTPVEGIPVGFAHTSVREWQVRPRVALYAGPRAAVLIDTPRLTYSQLELGASLGLATGRVDVAYGPAVTVPLAASRSDVFDGELRRSAALLVMPLHLTVRVRLGPRRRA